MTEKLLQFIWRFQYYSHVELHTVHGEKLQIIQQGQPNAHQGPDFTNAKICIGSTMLVGNIELHIHASDWLTHKHSGDPNYNNIVLHVVWHHDRDILMSSAPLPTLALQDRVPKILLDRYNQLMLKEAFVPCSPYLPVLTPLKWVAWKERLVIERLQRKAQGILLMLKEANNHWDEVFWWAIARNFGISKNADAFEDIARRLPIQLIAKHKNQLHQLEALLFGTGNLLNKDFLEAYPQMLRKEYLFLKNKYSLHQISSPLFFLRMRPANFPTIRLGQLAMLLHSSSHLFSRIREAESLGEVTALFAVTANDYWHYHYVFDDLTPFKTKQLGEQTINNILINTVVPVLFAYAHYQACPAQKDKALSWLSQISAEKNSITQGWNNASVTNANALESQALIELKNAYCNFKRCLDCQVGYALLRQ